MLIDDIDFAALYRQQLRLARRTEKTPAHWDKRAKAMAERASLPQDGYLQQLLGKIDLHGARTFFDMGCGPGNLVLAVSPRLEQVYGIDYSPGMLAVATRQAQRLGVANAHWIERSWDETWDDLPVCDIAVASRSTLPADLKAAMRRLNRQARLRVYTTHIVDPLFMPAAIQRALGRDVVELPTYIYAINILYQMGIKARLDFIRGSNYQGDNSTFERFCNNVTWSSGSLNDVEKKRLLVWYQQKISNGEPIVTPTRDWALISWTSVPDATLS
ncbi:methyltransferase [[Pantoea] beijingensis]|uniref:Methyltransferase n=1 Tax=[Pantoea] beijingensis TaxID=1324864 RepID=A0A443IH47_9GAMM|nr:class I SAM-dependent methyltransferase [[Pantoea] beijingensis]RWR03424.1 methyltransferase [[Pantoea] beijingensis]